MRAFDVLTVLAWFLSLFAAILVLGALLGSKYKGQIADLEAQLSAHANRNKLNMARLVNQGDLWKFRADEAARKLRDLGDKHDDLGDKHDDLYQQRERLVEEAVGAEMEIEDLRAEVDILAQLIQEQDTKQEQDE